MRKLKLQNHVFKLAEGHALDVEAKIGQCYIVSLDFKSFTGIILPIF